MPARPRIAPSDGLSHVVGGDTPPLADLTIADFLAATVARHGSREAVVFRAAGERWSYDQLSRRADRLAAGLLALGLYKGDRVGIWAPNRPEWLIAQFATRLMDRRQLEPARNAYHAFVTLPRAAPSLAYRYLKDRQSFYESRSGGAGR